MKTIRFVMLLGGALLCGAQPLSAALITFDFGTGDSNNNSQTATDGTDDPAGFEGSEPGNWTPFAADNTTPVGTSASITLSGLEMTINGVAPSAANWGANTQGIGIVTTSDGSGAAPRRRIDGVAGEAITFSFDQDVVLSSLTLGSFGAGEVATVTPAGGSVITFDDTESFGPTDLRSLGDVAVSAGTLITLTTTTPTGGGVLFNQITVDVIPEPSSIALVGMALVGLGFIRGRR